ncbi:MAG: alkaline phosphatase family protein [Planctomycetes bacterium]|nr:alkaline phosphatase family protein [Planctomycetota bacterium]
MPVLGYVGPGGGFAILVGFLAILGGIAAAVFALAGYPVLAVLRRLRCRRPESPPRFRRVVVLGLDGLDPEILDEFLAAGDLPNFRRLAESGAFRRLGTTLPAVSPVAWSSFQTGTNPGKHRIFDFLRRAPHSYRVELASMRIDPPRRIRIGRFGVPLGRARARLHRASRPFWSILGDYGIFSEILQVPITFPPEPFFGACLSGMDVPDLRGTMGTFTCFTDDPALPDAPIGGRTIRVRRDGNRVEGRLAGPEDPLSARPGRELSIPWRLDIARRRLSIGPERVALEVGKWSGWIPLSFRAAPGLGVPGMCQFLLRATDPAFSLFAGPIHVDPARPVLPVSRPLLYSVHLALRHGRFATLGQAEDTWALSQGFLSDDEFLAQARSFHEERARLFLDVLSRNRKGLVVFVLEDPDRVQHMFFRTRDPDHPANRGRDFARYAGVFRDLYRQMDDLLGKTLAAIDERTLLLVLSDHGFGSFRRQVDINAWLLAEGYLALADGAEPGPEPFEGVDWSRTRAYALGMGGIYLNLRGREGSGVVDPGEAADRLAGEIAARLEALVDPESGRRAVRRVHLARDAYRGPYAGEAPDLVAGFERCYRSSWGQVAGKISRTVFSDNTLSWSGDHAFDPEVVPGILFSNRPLAERPPHIQDIAPTVLDAFGVAAPDHMDGRSLLPPV